jgi:hypothetical protein
MLDDALDSYFEHVCRVAKHCGLKENRGGRDLRRIRWLVHWTVLNRTMRQIADDFDIKDEKDIKRAFAEFELYSLPKRRKRRKGGKQSSNRVPDFNLEYASYLSSLNKLDDYSMEIP